MGCAGSSCPPLDQVPIRNAEPEQETTLQDELSRAAADFALPVCIDHVHVGGIVRHEWGAYNTVTHGVRIAHEVALDDLPWILRHEICHGVDRQNDVVKDHPSVFDADDSSAGSVRRGEAEAFAELCQDGASRFRLLWDQDCPGDPDLAAQQVVRTEVYGLSDPAPQAWWEEIASTPVEPGMFVYYLLETAGGFLYFFPTISPAVFLDPWTGEVLDEDQFPTGATDTPLLSLDVPEPPGDWSISVEAGGRVDGETQVASTGNGEAQRFSVLRDGAWAPADAPCPDDSTRFLMFDGELWSSQVFGDRLTWGRWHAGARPAR
jgi:hypothetical protein